MAEGRFISRSIATNGQLKRVSFEADYLFTKMIPHLDREGRIDGDPDVVKAMACPLRGEMTSELIATCLAELDSVGLIEWYEVDGRQVAQFPAFKAHQRGMKPERERASVLPGKDAQGSKPIRRTVASGIPPAASGVRAELSPTGSPTSAPKVSEVKVSEVKSRSERYAFMGVLRPIWKERYGGEMPKGAARDLAPLCEELGIEVLSRRLTNYVAVTEAQYVSIPRFRQTHGSWDTAKSNGVLPIGKAERDAAHFKKMGYVTK